MPLNVAPVPVAVVEEELEGCPVLEVPNSISSVVACQKFMFAKGVTFVV